MGGAMNVVIDIEGREAIPIRALPWLTSWEFCAQDVVEALAHYSKYETFQFVEAFRFEDDEPRPIARRDWERSLQAIEEVIQANYPRQKWEDEATRILPAGSWVWRDEWERAFNASAWGPDDLEKVAEIQADNDDAKDRLIDLAPNVPHNLKGVVLEGFEPQQTKSSTTMTDAILHRLTPLPAETPALATGGAVAVTDASAATVAPVAVIEATLALPDAPEPPVVPAKQADAELVLGAATVKAWTLTKPKRFQGYTEPLYLLLEAAHIAGQSRPTARDVLQAFATNQPSQIAKVIEGDSLDYYIVKGTTKTANLKAIREAITGMTGKSQN